MMTNAIPEIPVPDQENPQFATWKRPKDKTLGEWIETRIARRATRSYDWNALGWQADVDPIYRRAQTRYIGTGAAGVSVDQNSIPAEHFTFSTMVLPAGCEGPLHVHHDVEEAFFILRGHAIRHIPDKHFKMIRYYGIYAKQHPQMPYFRYAINPDKRKILRSFNRWRDSIALSFGLDPLLCSCGHTMSTLEIYRHHTALFHQYLRHPDSS